MPIPIAKEQDRFDVPQAASGGGQSGKIMPIDTGLPQATANLTDSIIKAHNALAQIKIDNDTARANQLTLELEKQQTELLTSTETDENGEVIGFLNKKGNEAFNSIESLDKRLAQTYNAYLSQMSKLSPVAIEKLLLKGKDITNNTQEKAFQHAYNEHNEYVKNVSLASKADIIKNAAGDDKILNDKNLNHFELIKQDNETIYRGYPQQYIDQKTQEDIEKYMQVATDDLMKKFSNSPVMGAGANVAKNFLQDAFNKGYISEEFRAKQGHTIDQEAALSVTGKLTLENYDKSAKFIRSRTDLKDSEKNLYINNLDKAREDLKKKSGGAIANDISWKFNVIPTMPHSGAVNGIVGALVKNELTPFIDEKDKKMKFIHNKRGVQTVVSLEQYARDYGFGSLFDSKSDIEAAEKEQEIGYIWNVASNLYTASKNGATSEDFRKILQAYERDVKSDLPTDIQNKYDGNEAVIKNTHVNYSGKGTEKTGELNDSALERGMMGYSDNRGAPNESEARRAVSNLLRTTWNEALLQVDAGDNIYERNINAAKKVKELMGRKSTIGISHGGNEFVNSVMDDLILRMKRAESNEGFEIIIPSGDGTSLSAIYKGEIDVGNVIFNYMDRLLQEDFFMNSNGRGLKDRYEFLQKSQKDQLTNMLQEQLRTEVGYNALERRSHLVYKANGLTLSAEDADLLLRKIIDKGANASAIVSDYADIPFPYSDRTSPIAGTTVGIGAGATALLLGAGTGGGALVAGGLGLGVYGLGDAVIEGVFGDAGFSQIKTYNTGDLKLYTVTSDEYKKASKEGRIYADTVLTPIIDYSKNYVKEEMPVLLDSLGNFMSFNIKLSPAEQRINILRQDDLQQFSGAPEKEYVSGSLKILSKQDIVKKNEFVDTLNVANDRLRDTYKQQFGEDFNEDYFNAFIAKEENADVTQLAKRLAKGDRNNRDTWYTAAAIAYDLSLYTRDDRDIAYFNFDSFNKAQSKSKKRYTTKLK